MFPVKYLWSDKLTINPKKGTWIVCSLFQICIPQTFCRCLVIQYPVGICSERRNEKQVKGWGTVATGEGKWHMENIYILSWNNTESQQNRQAHCGCISLKKRQRIKLLIAIQHETICHWQDKASASFSPMLTTEYTASSTVPLLQLLVLRVKVLS